MYVVNVNVCNIYIFCISYIIVLSIIRLVVNIVPVCSQLISISKIRSCILPFFFCGHHGHRVSQLRWYAEKVKLS